MTIKRSVSYIFMLIGLASATVADESIGISLDKGTDPRSLPPRTDPAFSIIKDRIENKRSFGALSSFIYANDKMLFALFEQGVLSKYLKNGKIKYSADWPLTRWPDELDEVEEGTLYWDGYLHDQDWGQLSLQTRTSDQSLGCLMHSPLRYGQFVDPNQSVLVTFLGRGNEQLDMVVFSPEQETVIFSARLAHQDSYSTESFPGNPQWQHQGYAFETRGIYPGFRLYAKVFVGDFTGDGVDDLIQWRKQFAGRRTEDPVKGYELRHEVLHLYTLKNGEFERQSMDSEEVKEALSEHSLTWQKGYPSKSECAEEEGELIPEMHDPLLNDPDVLK